MTATEAQRGASVHPAVPERVGVVGGGRMGAGIAHAFLLAGARVTVIERDGDAAGAARARVTEAVRGSAQRGTLHEPPAGVIARLTVDTDQAALAGVQLVVEAVPEDVLLKVSTLRRAEEIAGPASWLATNTSSISVDTLAAELRRPERFCGLHFFNPVPASALVEVVIGTRTRADLAELALAWVEALGKTAVVVKDAPGFASSRLGVVIALEAMRMVEEGVASPEDIDNAMTLGYKFPVGPLRLTDIVGLDVRLGIAEYLHSQLGERFAVPRILREKVERGELGRKTGQGFFSWTD